MDKLTGCEPQKQANAQTKNTQNTYVQRQQHKNTTHTHTHTQHHKHEHIHKRAKNAYTHTSMHYQCGRDIYAPMVEGGIANSKHNAHEISAVGMYSIIIVYNSLEPQD